MENPESSPKAKQTEKRVTVIGRQQDYQGEQMGHKMPQIWAQKVATNLPEQPKMGEVKDTQEEGEREYKHVENPPHVGFAEQHKQPILGGVKGMAQQRKVLQPLEEKEYREPQSRKAGKKQKKEEFKKEEHKVQEGQHQHVDPLLQQKEDEAKAKKNFAKDEKKYDKLAKREKQDRVNLGEEGLPDKSSKQATARVRGEFAQLGVPDRRKEKKEEKKEKKGEMQGKPVSDEVRKLQENIDENKRLEKVTEGAVVEEEASRIGSGIRTEYLQPEDFKVEGLTPEEKIKMVQDPEYQRSMQKERLEEERSKLGGGGRQDLGEDRGREEKKEVRRKAQKVGGKRIKQNNKKRGTGAGAGAGAGKGTTPETNLPPSALAGSETTGEELGDKQREDIQLLAPKEEQLTFGGVPVNPELAREITKRENQNKPQELKKMQYPPEETNRFDRSVKGGHHAYPSSWNKVPEPRAFNH